MANTLRNHFMPRMLSLLLLLGVCLPLWAQSPAETMSQAPALNPDKCAVMIIDLKSGKTLDSWNADTPLVPASVTKAVTMASAMSRTGIDYRFHTRVYRGGKVKDGVLLGNLIVRGGGDPTLGTPQGRKGADFIAAIIKALKIHKTDTIDGTIEVDGSVFDGPATHPDWQPGDLPHSYGTGCHGFNWQHNAVGKQSVADPAATFRRKLLAELSKNNIQVNDNEYESSASGKPIVDFTSEPSNEIMRYCMRESDNLYAEAFLRTFAMLSDHDASFDEGAALETKMWKKKGCHTAGVMLRDGSGLARSNRMTARFLAEVLVKMAKNADYVSFFPMAGVEGTVKNFLKGTSLEDYIALKSGSMRGVHCYAGYKLDDDYAPTHAVVVLINDFKGSRAEVRSAIQQMLLGNFPDN